MIKKTINGKSSMQNDNKYADFKKYGCNVPALLNSVSEPE